MILTAPWNHTELAQYETINTKCILIEHLGEPTKQSNNAQTKYTFIINKIIKKIEDKLNNLFSEKTLLKRNNIDLLFCPFSAPNFAEKDIPTVAIVYDLQHLDYPEFFTTEERQRRDEFLGNLLQVADKIACISEFSRQSFITKLNASPQQLDVVHISVHERWKGLKQETVKQYLQELDLLECNYAFYPANYWPHKNHRTLLAAYQIYQQQFPDDSFDLVFTGALKQEEQKLREMVTDMELAKRVHFLGYLSEEALEAIFSGCKCLVFPSLYEGFGIPVLEAMVFGKPVVSSNAGSLPEVGGDAVLYFDPNNPEEIANCLVRITRDTQLVNELVQKGYEQIKLFEPEVMARQYLKIFSEVAKKHKN